MKEFFDKIRDELFGGNIGQAQVDNINIILAATKHLSIKHRAYIFGTCFHETGPSKSPLHMTPRKEIWGPTEAQRKYEGRSDLGNTFQGDGKRFMGRGYVQITGRANYAKASKLCGVDMVGDPDLAMIPRHAVKILVDGMENGWFTGRKLADYSDYRSMRRIVNGTDKADLISGYAKRFEAALMLLEPISSDEPTDEAKPRASLISLIIEAILSIFRKRK